MSIGLAKPAAMGLQLKAAGSGNSVGGAGDAGRSVGGGRGAVGCGDAAVASGAWIATVAVGSPAGSVVSIREQANNSGTATSRTRCTGLTPRVIRIVSLALAVAAHLPIFLAERRAVPELGRGEGPAVEAHRFHERPYGMALRLRPALSPSARAQGSAQGGGCTKVCDGEHGPDPRLPG